MSVAPILGLRKAIITHLRADASVTSLGTPALAARIYGERTPAEKVWPFVRYGQSDALAGYEITAPIHVFSKAEFTDEVAQIAEAIGNSLDPDDRGLVLVLSDGRLARLRYLGHQVIPDAAEATAWHAIVRIGANVVKECFA